MKLILLSLLTTLLSLHSLSAQNFMGKIKDTNGNPIAGVTIYIREINLGILCNQEGIFQTKLEPGKYTVEFRCMNYDTQTRLIEVKSTERVDVNIELIDKSYELLQVEITSKEDPAYAIMRKAISKAPHYANIVNGYKAHSYIKGNGRLSKVTKLAEMLIGDDNGLKLSDFKDQTFVQESFNEITFSAPDKYEQNVLAFSSSFPDNVDSRDVMGIIHGSLYNEKFNGSLSPLSKTAFAHYRFRYEGFIEEKGSVINKIKVTSKVYDPQLFNGYLYIAENTSHVHYAELTVNIYGLKPTYLITFEEIGKDAYLPITYQANFEFDILGVQGYFDYYASLIYDNIKLKDKHDEFKPSIKPKREFEIKSSNQYKVKSDSLASMRDSSYWVKVRSIPLKKNELISYLLKDSMQYRIDSLRLKRTSGKFSVGGILAGDAIGNDSSKIIFKYNGLLRAVPQYNFVDGFWLGQSFEVDIKLDTSKHLKIKPYLFYTYSRKKMLWGGKIEWDYAPLQFGKLELEGGSKSEDFNPIGLPRFNNSLLSLIQGKNKTFFYEKDYLSVYNRIDIANGLILNTGFEIAKRSSLRNHTDYTWGKKKYIKDNWDIGKRFDRTAYTIGLVYAPYAYYRKERGKKEYLDITSPLFAIKYREGFGSWQKNNSRFRSLEGSIKQQIKLSMFNYFSYDIQVGGFLGNTKRLHFTDYHHFNTANSNFILKSPFDSYMLLDNYVASSNNWWLQSNINYTDKYLIIKYIPFFQGKMFTENLHIKNLYTHDYSLYTEVGYSVDFLRSMNLGIFASFRKGHYQAIGIRYGLDLKTLFNF